MERITIEVNDKIAKSWRYASDKKKSAVSKAFEKVISTVVSQQEDDFWEYINEIKTKVSQRGLSEEKLNKILREK